MSPGYANERDEVGSLSPELKRRRVNGDRPSPVTQSMPPCYCPQPTGGPIGLGTPFPFGHCSLQHPYPPAVAQIRRDSLPGLRGMASLQSPMAPPPRPELGYQQHRMSQGHIPQDRSLTLPPLQPGSMSGPSGVAPLPASPKSTEEQIGSISFRYKVKVLGQVAPPAVLRGITRGPLIAVEGDSDDAVVQLGKWLRDELGRGVDLTVNLIDGPILSAHRDKNPYVQYHLLAMEWVSKSDDIVATLNYKPSAPAADTVSNSPPIKEPVSPARKLDADYSDSDSNSGKTVNNQSGDPNAANTVGQDMDVDKTPVATGTPAALVAKPVAIVSNYSVHASNVFACRIPISPQDHYSPSDHWQWAATQWRGVVGPDLTVYLRDAVMGESGKPTVEMLEEGNIFVVKRTKSDGEDTLQLEPITLRRLGFEVGEWVRAFGAEKNVSV